MFNRMCIPYRELLLAASALAVTANGQAEPLRPTEWTEAVAFCGDDACKDLLGADDLAPEALTGDLSGQDWSFEGGVILGPPGQPAFSVQLDVDHASGLSRYQIGRGLNTVIFEFRVRAKGTPPVAVTGVPLTIHMRGAASTEGDPLPAYAYSSIDFAFAATGVPWTAISARGTNDPHNQPTADTFDEVFRQTLAPGIVIFGLVGTQVRIEGVPRSGHTRATASVATVIEVEDELIPGTSTSYRDFFAIEFSPGYELAPTATQPATWSAMKLLYRSSGLDQ